MDDRDYSDTDSSLSFLSGTASVVSSKKSKRPRNTEEKFVYVNHVRENHGQSLFGVAVSPFIKNAITFATTGSNRCTIYQIENNSMKLLQCYSDADPNENFYCCVWLYDTLATEHLVAFAGKLGSIRIISPRLKNSVKELIGHGNSINDMVVHPLNPNLLLSSSKDHTLRLWNVRNGVCVAIFGGSDGHCDEVLSGDFDPFGEKIVSSGIDHSIKVWNLANNSTVLSAIKSSDFYNVKESRSSFKTVKNDFPDFSTKDIHSNYVDSVKWFGDLIISKSCENIVSIWKLGDLNTLELSSSDTDVSKIRDYQLKNCNVWYMKMAIDWKYKWLSVGNQSGKIYVWDLTEDFSHDKPKILQHTRCTSLIRQVAFSADSNVLIAVCDDATIWRWDFK